MALPYLCDPALEDCAEEPQFKNTIELDYYTPNQIVQAVIASNFLIPVILYKLYFGTTRVTTSTSSLMMNLSWYKNGWRFAFYMA